MFTVPHLLRNAKEKFLDFPLKTRKTSFTSALRLS